MSKSFIGYLGILLFLMLRHASDQNLQNWSTNLLDTCNRVVTSGGMGVLVCKVAERIPDRISDWHVHWGVIKGESFLEDVQSTLEIGPIGIINFGLILN